ncbi:TPA: hypothetical protein JD344_12780 [Serratia marcescens]|nr:RHS domain-containing protein [Serratia marcescens]HAU5719447.1 hypothetical protein [Serratia marcescens]HAU5739376.1 hypothetical protein [Serratia marcescens]HAU5743889.1 hypothetical protein [Serratia marcescens]HAU5757879.1 hypothetical protein [Serratia marcescens]
MLQEQRDDGSRRSWSYDPASPWSPLAALEQAGDSRSADIYWYHTDLNSAPLEVTDAAGNLCWSGQYDTFGKLQGQTVAGAAKRQGAQYQQPLRYAGQYQDDESGLHYNLFRYYEPEVGRFTTQDPIGLRGGLNLYQYAPNPLMWVDPFGLTVQTLIHYTTEEGLKGILDSGELRASSGPIHARFGDGQYLTDIKPEQIGGRTLKEAAGTGKLSLGQVAHNLYGDSRKINSITHYVEIDVTGLDVSEPRPNTFRVASTGNLDISKRIVKSGKSCGN